MANSNKYNFDDLNVEKCFEGFYVVPDYQREYVWEADTQVSQLLNDVYDAYSSDKDKEYFIGTTVVYDNHDQKELIDGQQRTTTLFLMLCAFRDLYEKHGLQANVISQKLQNCHLDKNGNEIYEPRLVLQYSDSEDVLGRIVRNEEIKTLKSNSARRLVEAYSTIYSFIDNNTVNDSDELKRFFMYFFRMLKFIQILTPDINDALKIFETINDRGVGLNPMDLLKNLIFQQVERSKFDKLKDRWKVLVSILEQGEERPLRFLRYYIVSNHPSPNNSLSQQNKGENVVREDEIYRWFTRKENEHLYSDNPDAFVEELIENARCYVNFSHGKDRDGNENIYLDNIIRLGGNAFRQHLILLLTARNFTPEMFTFLSKSIETYLFYFLFTKEQAKIYEKQFGKWNLTLCKVQTFDDLKEWVADNIKPEVDKKESDFQIRFMNFRQGDLQVYRVRYILAKIAQYVDNARIGVYSPTPLSVYIRSGVEIEHILPWTALPEIKEAIPNYDSIKTMLGNLTLIEKSMNSVIGNKTYEEKVIDYAKCPYYITSSLAKLDIVGENSAINRVNRFLKPYERWDEVSIRDRQELLYQLALNIWTLY